MPFSPNPAKLSKAVGSGELIHTSAASSPVGWTVTSVKSSSGIVLKKSQWEFLVTPEEGIHRAKLTLKPGYEQDPLLALLFAQADQVSVKVEFSNGLPETLMVDLCP